MQDGDQWSSKLIREKDGAGCRVEPPARKIIDKEKRGLIHVERVAGRGKMLI
jgi:hypothetical protein